MLTLRVFAMAFTILLFLPSLAVAHPLGNFTINHYAGLRVEPNRVIVDLVVDEAEIPTFQEKQRLDADGNGVLSDAEIEQERESACPILETSLRLATGSSVLSLEAVAAGLRFLPGAGGLETMRLVCTFAAALPSPITGITTISFADESHAERIGWREITAEGTGVTVEPGGPPARSISERLTHYPTDMLTSPLDTRSVQFTVSAGGASLAPLIVPDAGPLPGAAGLYPGNPVSTGPGQSEPPGSGAVPGGVGSDISGLLQTKDLTPLVLIGSLLVAMGLGAGHALTPGHGKTLMAAYLVGTRGTPIQAIALGLSVTVSHTLGIVALAAIVIAFRGVLPPETFNRVAPLASGLLVLGIGGWLLITQLRARRAAGWLRDAEQDHFHEHDEEEHGRRSDHAQAHGEGHSAGDDGDDAHHPLDLHGTADAASAPGMHSHGGVRHSHTPVADGTLTWRNLFVLGLAGGIIPSTNALIILLATIATGRSAYGLVLVVAFGLGMALVLGGVGLALVLARSRIERLPARSSLGRAAEYAPLVAGMVVFTLGVVLTFQALRGASTL
ncbi:MAG TPA: hypothetical protein VGQ85_03275 [Candidatus Limnocylindrales bacterium]|nr:hypothetical protein [Candidatus Limnocylindrales bacterium]